MPRAGNAVCPIDSGWRVFFDFDNTLTRFDVLDDVIQRFAVDSRWMQLEEDWQAGKIGSRECLRGQLGCLRVSKKDLLDYLATIQIDPYLPELLTFLRARAVNPVIVSDSFSVLIRHILDSNGTNHMKIYANHVRFEKDRLIPEFRYAGRRKGCSKCAHCKRHHIQKAARRVNVYIGDGLSDLCAARRADLVFAKARLLECLRKEERPCVPFQDLGDVYNYLKSIS
jgi:2,3-diketo-5-methylthio-1-phosphopentane phosphatase